MQHSGFVGDPVQDLDLVFLNSDPDWNLGICCILHKILDRWTRRPMKGTLIRSAVFAGLQPCCRQRFQMSERFLHLFHFARIEIFCYASVEVCASFKSYNVAAKKITSGKCFCDCPRRRSRSDGVVCHNSIDVFYKKNIHTQIHSEAS